MSLHARRAADKGEVRDILWLLAVREYSAKSNNQIRKVKTKKRNQKRGRMHKGAYWLLVLMFTAGLGLTVMSLGSPEWSTNGSGHSGLLETCGCRSLDTNCKVGDSSVPGREKFFTGKTTCGEYIGARWLAVIAGIGFLFTATGMLTSNEDGVMKMGSAFSWTRPLDSLVSLSLWAGFGASVVAMILFVKIVIESGKNGLNGFDLGAVFFFLGMAIFGLVTFMWFVSFNSASRAAFGAYWSVGMLRLLYLFGYVVVCYSLTAPEWSQVQVRQDLITIPDVQTVSDDMHAALALDPLDTTYEARIADTLVPAAPGGAVGRAASLNLWGFCMCRPYSSQPDSCRWSGANFLSGDNCGEWKAARGFLIFSTAVIFAMGLVFALFPGQAWMYKTLFGLSIIASVAGIVGTSLYADAAGAIKGGTDPDGYAYILYNVGLFVTGLSGLIIGGLGINKSIPAQWAT